MAVNSGIKDKHQEHGPRPFSLRLTQAQRRELEARAGGVPLGEFIRAQLFSHDEARPEPVRPRSNRPLKDHSALAEVLAKLGASRLASNMNQLDTRKNRLDFALIVRRSAEFAVSGPGSR